MSHSAPPSSMHTVVYDLTIDDHVAGAKEPLVRQAALRLALLGSPVRTTIAIAITTATLTWAFTSKGIRGQPAEAWQIAATAGVFLVVVTTFIFGGTILSTRLTPWFVRRMVSKGAFGMITGPHTAELHDDAVVVKCPSGEFKYNWGSFQSMERGTTGVLFFLGPARALYIPLRAFANSNADAFLAEARRLHNNASPQRM